jgi:ribonuclease-3
VDAIFAAKTNRTKMEEEPAMAVPDTDQEQNFIIEQPRKQSDGQSPVRQSTGDEEYNLSDISATPKEKSREEIIAEAEAAAAAYADE